MKKDEIELIELGLNEILQEFMLTLFPIAILFFLVAFVRYFISGFA